MAKLGLEERVALVTGAASGIGAATVRAFLEAGAYVVAFDRAAIPPHDVHPNRCRAQLGDVTRQSDVDAGIRHALESFGRIDCVVHCAGITRDAVVWKLTDEAWSEVVDVNLTGSFHVVRGAVPVMRERGGGSIVLVASINAMRGKFGQANYAASKAGVIALAKTAAIEAGRFGVRVNTVAPGFVRTPMTAKLSGELQDQAIAEIPLGRAAEPEDVAGPILFLCSPLSRHVTGAVLRVDGGQCTAG